jgi:AbrB family looped-hinge helix DNA binding protein
MRMTYVATIDSRGRVTMPSELRRRLSLSAGDRVDFAVEKKRTILRFQHSGTNLAEKYEGKPGTIPRGNKQIQVWICRMRGK